MDATGLSRGKDALITAAGPLAQAGLTALLFVAWRANDGDGPVAATLDAVLTTALWLNAGMLAYNLLPFGDLDGGRLLRTIRGVRSAPG